MPLRPLPPPRACCAASSTLGGETTATQVDMVGMEDTELSAGDRWAEKAPGLRKNLRILSDDQVRFPPGCSLILVLMAGLAIWTAFDGKKPGSDVLIFVSSRSLNLNCAINHKAWASYIWFNFGLGFQWRLSGRCAPKCSRILDYGLRSLWDVEFVFST